jgi:hypothetical protein
VLLARVYRCSSKHRKCPLVSESSTISLPAADAFACSTLSTTGHIYLWPWCCSRLTTLIEREGKPKTALPFSIGCTADVLFIQCLNRKGTLLLTETRNVGSV